MNKPLVQVLPGILPAAAQAQAWEISAEAWVELLVASGRAVKVLERPDHYTGKGPALFFFTDAHAVELRETLLRYPHALSLNHALVHPRWSRFRWNRGLPLAGAFAEQAPARVLPEEVRLPPGIWPLERVKNVVLVAPTPPGAALHGLTTPAWLEKNMALMTREFPAAKIWVSIHPRYLSWLRGQGIDVALASELVKTADLAVTLQSVAVVDKFLVEGIPVLVDAAHHPLAACGELPDWHEYKLIDSLPAMVQALKQVAAHEVPVTVAGMAELLAEFG